MFRKEIEDHLRERILPFWMGLKDDEYGGYCGYMDFDLKVDKKAEKGCILNSRILWFFSTCALLLKDDKYLLYADHAYEFMKKAFIDEKNGGVFWSVTYDGKKLDTMKHTYCQAFAIYGLSAYYKASGNEESREEALRLSRVIEEKCRDKEGYLEAFNEDFTPASNEKLSENGVLAERTMNTLLHVFEAYTELLDATGSSDMKERLKEMLSIFKDRMYNPGKHRQEVFFDLNYNSLIDLISYGHDIETAWLIDRGLEVLGDDLWSKKMAPLIHDLADNILKNAFDGHSLPQECEDGKVNEDRVWWVQAETVNGFLNEYLKDRSHEEYRDAVLSEWEYIKEYVVDKRPGGEWFSQLDKDGKPYREKPTVEPWKCPYHNGRMCLEVIRRNVDF
ncbi:MAG: AGE family epimerase/isomerase [Lachnospiraceae bacterium]|nr:AGE family epimerase/isomerase [Lachnospiraceae bacterium]